MREGNYLIEVATSFRYIIALESIDDEWLRCSQAVWVADTGTRMGAFLRGEMNEKTELEDMGPGYLIPRGALTGVAVWNQPIPSER